MTACPILQPTAAALRRAAEIIRAGGLVAFPTETVYGLGADAENERAVAAIFAAKERPHFNPLIIHVADAAAARHLVAFDERAEKLAAAFWPGPLTLVLPRKPGCKVSGLASADLPTLAVRVPAAPVAYQLLQLCGKPLAAPSANPSGHVSPTTAQHVATALGDKIALVLDGGPCRVGVESTVIGLLDDRARLLRPGGVAAEAIEAIIGPLAPPTEALHSPGMLASHYAPGLPVRLNAIRAQPGEALLAFGPDAPEGANVFNLSQAGDLEEAAANLFAALHALDRPAFAAIAVMPIPERGLGRAINDRLRRAAKR
jgi:L-threonylcarbamoyladenylate synthase